MLCFSFTVGYVVDLSQMEIKHIEKSEGTRNEHCQLIGTFFQTSQ